MAADGFEVHLEISGDFRFGEGTVKEVENKEDGYESADAAEEGEFGFCQHVCTAEGCR